MFRINRSMRRAPSQLYEAFLEGLVAICCFIFYGIQVGFSAGRLTGIFLIGYGSSKFLVEYFRVPDPQFFSSLNPNGYAFTVSDFGLTMGQLLSVSMIILGVLFINNLVQKVSKI